MKRVATIIVASAIVLNAPRMGAQAPPRDTGLKSPTVARLVGVAPGVGHMYAGEVGHGFAYMGGTVGLFALTGAAALSQCLSNGFTEDNCGSGHTADVLAVATVGLWAWSIYDAGRAARRTNAKRAQRSALLVRPGGMTAQGRLSQGTLRVGIGLTTR